MADLGKLLALVARLRAPGGCPWDREQTLPDLRAYLLEEAHETAGALDAVVAAQGEGGTWRELAGEVGDLLFQVAFLLRLGEEAGALTAGEVVDAVHDKMVARHPHVFPPDDPAGREELADAPAVAAAWEKRKLRGDPEASLLAGVPGSLPALLAAYRMTQKAAGVGFDWPDPAAVLAKLEEEIVELETALEAGAAADPAAIREEVGDVLFTVANLARKLRVDPEAALAAANAKFRRRFGAVERELARRGKRLDESGLAEMDAAWEAVKAAE